DGIEASTDAVDSGSSRATVTKQSRRKRRSWRPMLVGETDICCTLRWVQCGAFCGGNNFRLCGRGWGGGAMLRACGVTRPAPKFRHEFTILSIAIEMSAFSGYSKQEQDFENYQ